MSKKYKKHSYEDRLKYMRMMEDGYSSKYIHKHNGISCELLEALWLMYQEKGPAALAKKQYVKANGAFKEKVVRDIGENPLPLHEATIKYNVSVSSLLAWRRIVRECGYEALYQQKPRGRPRKEDRECSVKKSEGLSRGKGSPSARDRAKAIEELRPECNLELLLKFGKMARSTFYYHTKRIGQPDGYETIRGRIRAIYDKHHGRYGYRRITIQLHNEGIDINHKTVQKLMGQMSLKAKRKKQRYRSYKGELGKIAPNVIGRDFTATAPDQKWATDITQVKIKDRWIYLSPVLDMFNGEIVSYAISNSPDLRLVMTMLDNAFKKRNIQGNLIFHSDQGWHYQHKRYQKTLEDRRITQSMSRKGNCLDNAMMENFFGLMKNELLYLQEWDSIEQFKKSLQEYIRYYNNDRIKLRLKGKSPVQYRALFKSKAS